ncbi:hypothetical protein MHU86_10458 [Fragilaria crotonensis]|nr:hypothetical protein MHU86_10458 [Fragilaria crotonensis]
MKTCILALELFGIAINAASSFQPVHVLPRHHFVPPVAQRGRPLHVHELTQLLAFDFGDGVVSAAATVGAVIAASIVSREIAAATRKDDPVLEPNNKHFLPVPPKETPSFKLLDVIDVKEEVRTITAPIVEEEAPMPSAEVTVLEPVIEQVVVEPERSIVGVPYVSDSLIDNVHDYLEAVDETEGLIVDPLVLNDYEMDPVLDNPLLYEGGYYEDEEEELFGVYERVAIDEKDTIEEEEEFGTFGVPVNEFTTFTDVAFEDANDEIFSTFDPNRPLGTSSETSQKVKRPISYLETLAANTMSVDATPDPTYLEGLSKPNVREEPPIDQDSIAGVPYVSDSLVDAVEDGLIIVDSEERLTVDPLALSRMNEGDSFVELYEKAEPIVAQYDNSPFPEEAQIQFEVDRSEADVPAVAAIVSGDVVGDATTAPGSVPGGFSVEDTVDKSEAVSVFPDQGQLQAQLPTDTKPNSTNGIMQSTKVADILSLQEGDGMVDAKEAVEGEIPRQQLKLSKSSPSQNPSLQRGQVKDPKMDAVRKHLQEKAINMTNALLQKSEQQSQVIQRTARDFEEATEREEIMSSQVTEQVLILEKEVDKQKTKPLLNLEKGPGKPTSSNKTVFSLDKASVSQTTRKGGVLRILRQKKFVFAVAAMAVVVARRVILSIVGRGML